MTQPEALEPTAEEQTEPPGQEDTEALSPYRASLMEAVAVADQQPNLVEQTYSRIGVPSPENYTIKDGQVSLSELQPGDLVGWRGGGAEDSYQGNLAVYAGNREIIEPFFQTTRRRKIADNENVFGIQVVREDILPEG